MYYKIIKNNQIIDVNNVFLCLSKKHPDMLMPCEVRYTQFLQSSDNEQLYTTNWTIPVQHPCYVSEVVDAIIIEEEEYLTLKKELQNNNIIAYQREKEMINEEEDIETPNQPEVLNINAMQRKILELEELVKQLLNK